MGNICSPEAAAVKQNHNGIFALLRTITLERLGFSGGSVVNNLPAKQETRVLILNQNLLKEEMATYSSILAWEIPWTEEPGRLQSMGSQRVGHN